MNRKATNRNTVFLHLFNLQNMFQIGSQNTIQKFSNIQLTYALLVELMKNYARTKFSKKILTLGR